MHLRAADFSHNNQQGQASVFVLALLGVVLLCAVFLYQSGRITSEKMQLQNAADAAAFGASTLEARSLNFAAYTNRAMVANEVAVGQLIGLLSWTDELTQSEEYTEIYVPIIEAAGAALAAVLVETAVGPEIVEAVTQVIVDALEGIAGALTAVGETMEVVLDAIVSPTVGGLSLINEVYSVSQRIYHGATYASVVKNVYQSLEDNVLDTEFNRGDLFKKDLHGAQLSDLGVIALVGHIPSFWSGYTKVYTSSTTAKKKKKKDEKKKKKDEEKKKKDEEKKKKEKEKDKDKDKDKKKDAGKDKKEDKKKDDKKKDKKDDKKKKKKKAKKDKDNSSGMGRFAATVREARDPFSSGGSPESRNRDWNLELEIKAKIDLLVASFKFDYILGGESQGASELRSKNDTFIWSAADSSVLGSKIQVKVNVLGIKYKTPYIPFPAEFPFNAGGYQAPEEMKDLLLPTDILPSNPAKVTYGERKVEAYGGAVGLAHIAAYPGVEKEMAENSIDSYKGLHPYRDMKDMKEKKPGKFSMPFQAPFFLVGVTKALNDITEKGPQFTGKLELTKYDSKVNVDKLGAIAKSELYFARPTNLKYFLRNDKAQEKPNVFSPFWQARLVDTSNTDRLLALAMQQKVIWLTEKEKRLVGGSVLDDVVNVIDEILNVVSGVVDRIIRLFL